jgi:hypothetical protein
MPRLHRSQYATARRWFRRRTWLALESLRPTDRPSPRPTPQWTSVCPLSEYQPVRSIGAVAAGLEAATAATRALISPENAAAARMLDRVVVVIVGAAATRDADLNRQSSGAVRRSRPDAASLGQLRSVLAWTAVSLTIRLGQAQGRSRQLPDDRQPFIAPLSGSCISLRLVLPHRRCRRLRHRRTASAAAAASTAAHRFGAR